MSSRSLRIDTGMRVSFIASAVIHLAVFLLLVWGGQLFSPQRAIQETYYVDVVNLPSPHPQSGSSTERPDEAESASPPVPSPPMMEPSPSGSAAKTGTKFVKPVAPRETAETEAAFAERMAKIEGKAEAQQYEDRLKRLGSRNKSINSTKVGAPTADGSEAGSRYSDYIKSRLEDALKLTSFYTTKKPEVTVRLAIAADGRLLRMEVKLSSGDKAFEKSVTRAIELASEKFTVPPNRTIFENNFIFKPKGISSDTTR